MPKKIQMMSQEFAELVMRSGMLVLVFVSKLLVIAYIKAGLNIFDIDKLYL